MLTIKNLTDTKDITEIELRAHICRKITLLLEEYNVSTLDDIGCFLVLDKSENQNFVISDMEFIEVITTSGGTYLHGAKIISDSYAEDVYLEVEAKKC